MKPIDWLIVGALSLLLMGVTAHLIKRKTAGESGCGCGCHGCPSAGDCHAKPTPTEEENV